MVLRRLGSIFAPCLTPNSEEEEGSHVWAEKTTYLPHKDISWHQRSKFRVHCKFEIDIMRLHVDLLRRRE